MFKNSNNSAKYAIISATKISYLLLFRTYAKFIYHCILGRTRLKDFFELDEVKYTNFLPIIGHRALALSLFRGFQKLNIPYTYNKITKSTENIILLWTDKKELMLIEKLKNQGKIKKVVTAPTACKYDYHYLQWHFSEINCIDYALYASNWVADIAKSHVDKIYWHKIKIWPSGVDIPNQKQSSKINKSCILYIKRTTSSKQKIEELQTYIESQGIKCYIINYGEYKFNYWEKLLDNVDFVIFYQDCKETQGLAIAEAWAHNKPTFIKNTIQNDLKIINSCPYLTEKAGLPWTHIEDIKSIILEYKQNPELFISKFNPYEYAKDNFSDEISVKMIVDLFNLLPD